jgi:hypothetical protein
VTGQDRMIVRAYYEEVRAALDFDWPTLELQRTAERCGISVRRVRDALARMVFEAFGRQPAS